MLRLSHRADKYLFKLDKKTHKKILDRLETLKADPYNIPGENSCQVILNQDIDCALEIIVPFMR